ncbi:MAG: OmpA family protein [Candidatus Hydrogenedentes bacterium]|nr:OmpA family protein [Candidatus Hydrogenedentota bacterium]
MTSIAKLSMALSVAMVVTPWAFAADCCAAKAPAEKGASCGHASSCGHGACDHHTLGCGKAHSGCCNKDACCGATEWADASKVHWAHKGVSFGNYMKLAKAEIPPAACCALPPSFRPIFFDLDQAALRPESLEVCRQLADYLKANPHATVRIDGYCCDLGSDDYNKKLGARRAAAVKKFLVDNGVAAKQIKTTSRGEAKPKYGADQREMNRRDDFVIQCADGKKKS